MGKSHQVTRDCRKAKARRNGRKGIGADENEAERRTSSRE